MKRPFIPSPGRVPGGGPLLSGKVVVESADGMFLGICPTAVLDELLASIEGSETFVISEPPVGRYSKSVSYPLTPYTAALKAGV